MDVPRNMTGLYLGGFIQEGYLPPRERKSTIPSTLYRGHVVKLARAPNSNPHRSSVGRYPMHSLNSGFSGAKVPIKDQMNFKSPEEQRDYWRPRTRGKWTDHPMSIEIKKLAGNGESANYLVDCVLTGKTVTSPSRSVTPQREVSPIRTAMSFSPLQYRDGDDDHFYQSMFEEIRQVVTNQDEIMRKNREKLRRILINDSNPGIRPDVVSPARGHNRVATSYGSPRRGIPRTPAPKRPHTTLPPSGSLLLPVPFVMQQRPHTRDLSSVNKRNDVTPWLPSVAVTSPRVQKARAELNYRDESLRWNTPEPLTPVMTSQSNIGMTSFERLQRLLDRAEQENLEEDCFVGRQRIGLTVQEIASRKLTSDPEQGQIRIDACTSPTEVSALSVVVPASFREEASPSSSPLPPSTDQRMGSAASKHSKRKINRAPSTPSSEVSIKLTVEGEDGIKEPANIDMDASTKKKRKESIEVILDEVETQAEKKRRELENLLLEHQQIVDEIVRLETSKTT